MADTLSWKLKSRLEWSNAEDMGTDTGSITDSAELKYDNTLADGTGASQADVIYRARKTRTTGNTDTYDLTALTYATVFGYTTAISLSMAYLKGVLIVNEETTSGYDIYLNNNTANGQLLMFNGADSSILIPADSVLMITNKVGGWLVTAAATDKLRITNDSGSSVTYRIALAGTTA